MKRCWPDGELRAYLDGELPADTLAAVGAHLEDCPACSARYRELSGRADCVSNWMAALVETPAPPVRMAPGRSGHRTGWAVAGLLAAAAVVAAFVLAPKKPDAPVTVQPAAMAQAPVEPAPAPKVAAVQPALRHRSPKPAAARAEFLRLDDEPIETATIERVSAENSDIQADLLVGPDGRVHAIRFLSNQ